MSDRISRTRWGGISDGDGAIRRKGYFRVVQRDGVFWLVDPDGGLFLSKGVNTVCFDQDRVLNSPRIPYAEACARKYGNEATWRGAAAARLADWGFNTLGAWSDERVADTESFKLAMTPNLDLGMSFARRSNERFKEEFPDVFDAGFENHVRSQAGELCAQRLGDQRILGWFIDNELRWAPDWRGSEELISLFLGLGKAAPGRTAAFAWLRARYPDFQKFNSIWRTAARSWDALAAMSIEPPYRRVPVYLRNAVEEQTANNSDPARAEFFASCDAFAALVGERYFEATCHAIRAADRNHLILGCRFAYVPPAGVVEAAVRHCDVISLNCYDIDAGAVIDAYGHTGKPCLIGEFSFRGADSGLPNTNGAGPLVPTQAERAAAYRRYVTAALSRPTIVGLHWFEHADQPAEGRFDGENSNFGIVSVNDDIYRELAQTMKSVNAEAEALHRAAGRVS